MIDETVPGERDAAHLVVQQIRRAGFRGRHDGQRVRPARRLSCLSLHTVGLELDNRLIAVLDVEGAPVVRAWNVVHMLSKLMSPAAEAFRYFVLERGEAFLAENFGRHVKLGGPS